MLSFLASLRRWITPSIALTIVFAMLLFVIFGSGIGLVEASGSVSWSANGITPTATTNTGFLSGDQTCGEISSKDGCVALTTAGEYIYAWLDNSTGTTIVRAQKLNAS